MPGPLASILVPTYNYRRYLPEALESALRQSATDIEIVVVDNCSEDGTRELLEEYARRDPRIVAHRNDANLGMVANFNRCIELARGTYLKFLCADDVLEPACVERLVAAIEASPGIALAGCARRYFRDDGAGAGTRGYAAPGVLPGEAAIRDCFFRGNLIGEPTAVLFRRSEARGGFDAAYRQAFDMELWFRLLEGGGFAYVEAPLCAIREHGSSGTAENLKAGNVTEDKVRLFRRYAGRPWLRGSPWERLRWDARMASSVARESAAGATRNHRDVPDAVYYPGLFRAATLPLARTLTALRS
jgi:glycosyltransferase involved in cell wall biosynthesis